MSHINNQETIFIDLESQLNTSWPDGIMVFCKDTNNTWVLDNGVFVPVGGTNIFIQNGINTFTGGTTSLPTVNITAATLNNLQVSGQTLLTTVSASTFSGGTYLSGGTNLYSIFHPIGSNTVISAGTNTYTAGTFLQQTVNISAATLNNLTVSGQTVVGTISASTFSGGTYLSGGTNLYNIFLQTAYSGGTSPFSGTGNGNIIQTNSTLTNRPLNNATERSLAINSAEISSGATGYAFGGDGSVYQVFIGALTGESNTVTNSVAFGASYDNGKKGVNASGSFGLGMQYWIKSGSSTGFILGGIDNIIGYNRYSAGIIGGSGNTINSVANTTFPYLESRNAVIINGFRNAIISGITGTTVIGGRLLTATTDDTTYTNNLVVTGTSMGNIYATNIFSGSTNISSLFGAGGGGSAVSNGTNTYTAGTFALTSVNVSALTINTLTASGASTFTNTLSAATLSAATMISGSTNLYNIFAQSGNLNKVDWIFALSDETSQIQTGTSKVIWYAPYNFTLTEIRTSLSMSGSVSATTVDVKLTGTTVFSTKPTIDAGQYTSIDSVVQPVITATTVTSNQKMTVDITTIGTGCTGAKIYIMGTKS